MVGYCCVPCTSLHGWTEVAREGDELVCRRCGRRGKIVTQVVHTEEDPLGFYHGGDCDRVVSVPGWVAHRSNLPPEAVEGIRRWEERQWEALRRQEARKQEATAKLAERWPQVGGSLKAMKDLITDAHQDNWDEGPVLEEWLLELGVGEEELEEAFGLLHTAYWG